jgi:uncharacterized membrane protein
LLPGLFSVTLPQHRCSSTSAVLFNLKRAKEKSMAFCNMCGTQIADGTTTCAACNNRSATAPAAPTSGLADNVAGMLAYFTIIPAIIFLVLEPYNRNRFVRFHAWQSIFFNVAWWVLWIGLRIVAHIPFLGFLTVLVWPLIGLGGFIVWIILVMKANQGQTFKLPVIGDLAQQQVG